MGINVFQDLLFVYHDGKGRGLDLGLDPTGNTKFVDQSSGVYMSPQSLNMQAGGIKKYKVTNKDDRPSVILQTHWSTGFEKPGIQNFWQAVFG